ncbi:hypothetical protein BGX34_000020 [Mortierella sp. NVP85]|nr:hypothetical protein BGX34_000020 [Mortierella sp. NVP85]
MLVYLYLGVWHLSLFDPTFPSQPDQPGNTEDHGLKVLNNDGKSHHHHHHHHHHDHQNRRSRRKGQHKHKEDPKKPTTNKVEPVKGFSLVGDAQAPLKALNNGGKSTEVFILMDSPCSSELPPVYSASMPANSEADAVEAMCRHGKDHSKDKRHGKEKSHKVKHHKPHRGHHKHHDHKKDPKHGKHHKHPKHGSHKKYHHHHHHQSLEQFVLVIV